MAPAGICGSCKPKVERCIILENFFRDRINREAACRGFGLSPDQEQLIDPSVPPLRLSGEALGRCGCWLIFSRNP